MVSTPESCAPGRARIAIRPGVGQVATCRPALVRASACRAPASAERRASAWAAGSGWPAVAAFLCSACCSRICLHAGAMRAPDFFAPPALHAEYAVRRVFSTVVAARARHPRAWGYAEMPCAATTARPVCGMHSSFRWAGSNGFGLVSVCRDHRSPGAMQGGNRSRGVRREGCDHQPGLRAPADTHRSSVYAAIIDHLRQTHWELGNRIVTTAMLAAGNRAGNTGMQVRCAAPTNSLVKQR